MTALLIYLLFKNCTVTGVIQENNFGIGIDERSEPNAKEAS